MLRSTPAEESAPAAEAQPTAATAAPGVAATAPTETIPRAIPVEEPVVAGPSDAKTETIPRAIPVEEPVVAAPGEAKPAADAAKTATAAAVQSAATGATGSAAAGSAAAGKDAPKRPAWADEPHVTATVKAGSTGQDVITLQMRLGVEPSGMMDEYTLRALKDAQKAAGLSADGVAGPKTLAALGLRDPFRSQHHSEDAFMPTYRATAYSESNSYRTKADPYAVGAITRPARGEDDGGKTYGTYQFESYTYRDGSKKSDKAVAGSTVMRFVNWKDNPYGKELQEVVKKHGVASAEFDAAWKGLAGKENGAFGRAQEAFLEHDKLDEVSAFYDRAKVAPAARKDVELTDVVMGTVNQYGSLTGAQADAVAAAQKKAGRNLTADEIGRTLQDFKSGNVTSNFKSSPKAWGGIRERIGRERGLFE